MKPACRNDNEPGYFESYPDLDAAVQCFCGSNAASAGARTPNCRLVCQNRRCGRTTTPGKPLEDAIKEWNASVAQDSCIAHTWQHVAGKPHVMRCRECGKEKGVGSARV